MGWIHEAYGNEHVLFILSAKTKLTWLHAVLSMGLLEPLQMIQLYTEHWKKDWSSAAIFKLYNQVDIYNGFARLSLRILDKTML